MKKYYPGEPVNILTQSLINIIQDNNRVVTTKKVQESITIILWLCKMVDSHLCCARSIPSSPIVARIEFLWYLDVSH